MQPLAIINYFSYSIHIYFRCYAVVLLLSLKAYYANGELVNVIRCMPVLILLTVYWLNYFTVLFCGLEYVT